EQVLNQLLESLLQQGVINQGEMESARAETRADRTRAVIDMVRRKGAEATSTSRCDSGLTLCSDGAMVACCHFLGKVPPYSVGNQTSFSQFF
uniref:CARD domain-containing protein n=1 Tax=Mastacembelus armatus TaxID=205130 RepID=A0A7N8X8K0_9TELE